MRLKRQQLPAVFSALPSVLLHEHSAGAFAHFVQRLGDGGQRRIKVFADRTVVKSDDPDVAACLQTAFAHAADETAGDHIVAGKSVQN